MAGAIKIKNYDAYDQSANRPLGHSKSRIGYMSMLCRVVQVEKYDKDSQTILPTLDELLAGHESGLVEEYRAKAECGADVLP